MKKKTENTGRRGGQLNNTNAEKWSEEEALKLGNDLIEWMSPKFEEGKDLHILNIFFNEYLVIQRGLYKQIISKLSERFPSFGNLIKRAKEMQGIKLWKYGALNKLNPAIVIFAQKVLHGHRESQEIDHKGIMLQVSPDFMPKVEKDD